MDLLKSEIHCHNVFSNGHVGKDETPFDCNVTIEAQLQQAHSLNIDVLFVTNHNTLDGYNQMLKYQKDHSKFQNIHVYPAVEVSTNHESHVLVYGLTEEIPAGLTLPEIIDNVKKQDAVTIAPHPFSLIDALREDSLSCDVFEVFNSSNVDVYSNLKAKEFAKDHSLPVIAGSDSHVASTLGRCINLIESENSLDGILYALKHNKIQIQKTGYFQTNEIIEHLRYKIENSSEYTDQYLAKFYPHYIWAFHLLRDAYLKYPDSFFWRLICNMTVSGLKKISKKINFEGYPVDSIKSRNLGTLAKMILF